MSRTGVVDLTQLWKLPAADGDLHSACCWSDDVSSRRKSFALACSQGSRSADGRDPPPILRPL